MLNDSIGGLKFLYASKLLVFDSFYTKAPLLPEATERNRLGFISRWSMNFLKENKLGKALSDCSTTCNFCKRHPDNKLSLRIPMCSSVVVTSPMTFWHCVFFLCFIFAGLLSAPLLLPLK